MPTKNTAAILLTIILFLGAFFVGTAVLAKIFGKPFIELAYENTTKKRKNTDIAIGIYAGENPFQLSEPRASLNPVLTADSVDDVEADFVADPFMIFDDNRWYMFFEVMNAKTQNGDIGLAVSADAYSWTYQKIILDEPFHLSYPLVFKIEDSYYMLPETNAEKSIRLYKATRFPYEWKFETVLLDGLAFTDSTIFKHDDMWWLFTETDPEKDGTLRLFYAADIRGPWREHPQSPLVEGDENRARPGGRTSMYNGAIYRVAQDDWPLYGNKLRLFQIDRLTIDDYAEHEICESPDFLETGPVAKKGQTPNWRADGIHHMDAHQVGGGQWIACVDGLRRFDHFKQRIIKMRLPLTRTPID